MRRIALLACIFFFVVAGEAAAAEIVRQDDAGRPIVFDVRAEGVDVDWYADLLRRAAHADEIAAVTVRIVSSDELGATCGRAAGGCYSPLGGRGVVVVRAGRDDAVAHALLHEYAHHIDRSYGHRRLSEPNGTGNWWAVRGMATLVRVRAVAPNYSLGWSHSIGEIFAEDYAWIHHPDSYRIEWLRPPGDVVRRALLADLGLAEAPPVTSRAPAIRPVVVVRRGTLAPRASASVAFGLLGPGRRVTFTAEVGGAGAAGTRARMEIFCGRRAATKEIRRGQARVTLDARDLGPGECRARLISTRPTPLSYTITVKLTIPVRP